MNKYRKNFFTFINKINIKIINLNEKTKTSSVNSAK